LRGELVSLIGQIDVRIPIIESEASNVADEYRERLTKRIHDILAKSTSQIEGDQSRLVQEVSYLADRSDISEEIARLKTHIEHFRSIMSEEKDVGKRLGFLHTA